MQYRALATDYDGTLAHDGHVSPETLAVIDRFRQSGRKLILVTGRQLPELQSVFPQVGVCDAIVAENGGLVFWPAQKREEILGEPPSEAFVAEMSRLEVKPFSVGRVIFATWRPFEHVILDAIQRLGTGQQIIFNERAIMVLPGGIDKATGLARVLKQLGLDFSQVVGVGNAENDYGFLECCGLAATVANALAPLKERCDLVTENDHEQGVFELMKRIMADDLPATRPHRTSTT